MKKRLEIITLIQSAISGSVALIVLALAFSLLDGMDFMDAFTAPYTMAAALAAAVGSCIGFMRKARKTAL